MSGVFSFVNRFQIIKQIPIFSDLNWFELQKLARSAIIADYKKGEIIRKEGDPPDYFYCLVSGRLQAYTLTQEKRKENVDFIHRGTYFGIVSLLTGKNHSLNFEAINDSVVLLIPNDDLKSILKTVPKLGVEFSHILSTRIRKKVTGIQSVFESKIISIYSPKKGTGSSTYAINMALSLEKETNKKVIFVNIHSGEARPPRDYVHDNVEKNTSDQKVIIDIKEIVESPAKISEKIIKGELKIDLLNVAFDPSDATIINHIAPFVSTLIGYYHYVVVDLPNNMDDVVMETLTQSDLIHLISTERENDLGLIRRVIDRLERNLKESFREEKIKVIVRPLNPNHFLSFEQINRFIDYHVYTMLPSIKSSDLKIQISSAGLSLLRCKYFSEYDKVVTRVAREIGGVLVGLVLGGGAALGIAHIGVLKVLEEENIPVDVVVGSSMGALIGSFWATGRKADEIKHIAKEFEKKKNVLKLLDPIIPIRGLIKGASIKRWLTKHLGNRTFYSTKIPLKVVAYDLVKREELVINGGSIVDAVCKSIAIPGVFKPITRKEQLIIDGGVMNPLPVNVLVSLGIKKIISVNVLQSPSPVTISAPIAPGVFKIPNEIG